jgi:hypothetical protein
MKKKINGFKVTMYVICEMFLMWFLVSYIDICAHNLSGHSDAGWNIFNMLMKGELN